VLVSFLFLLLAVQGTPIRSVSKDGGVELVSRTLPEKTDRTLESAGPDEAQEQLERIRELSPSIENTPEYAAAALKIADAASYERRAVSSLWRSIPDSWGIGQTGRRDEWDATVVDEDGRARLHVEVKYGGGGISDISVLRKQVDRLKARSGSSDVPVLLITNIEGRAVNPPEVGSAGVHLFRWRDESDDAGLRNFIAQLVTGDPWTEGLRADCGQRRP
jgi:hypothetical protein